MFQGNLSEDILRQFQMDAETEELLQRMAE